MKLCRLATKTRSSENLRRLAREQLHSGLAVYTPLGLAECQELYYCLFDVYSRGITKEVKQH